MAEQSDVTTSAADLSGENVLHVDKASAQIDVSVVT
jgi:hypothetical protein